MGRITDGVGHFRVRMTRYADVFERATSERLFPGTLNVDIGTPLKCREDFASAARISTSRSKTAKDPINPV